MVCPPISTAPQNRPTMQLRPAGCTAPMDTQTKKYWSKIPTRTRSNPCVARAYSRNEQEMFLHPRARHPISAPHSRGLPNAVRKCLLERFGVTETSSNSKPSGWRTRPGLSRTGNSLGGIGCSSIRPTRTGRNLQGVDKLPPMS